MKKIIITGSEGLIGREVGLMMKQVEELVYLH